MPELPDLTVYVEHLTRLVGGRRIRQMRIASPFVLRTHDPPVQAVAGRTIGSITLVGKRLAFHLPAAGGEPDLTLLIHLMIAGRLRWRVAAGGGAAPIPRKYGLAALDLDGGTWLLTEQGSKRRASVHIVPTELVPQFDRGGVPVLEASVAQFAAPLRAENHTLKRALTDPRLFSGVGNAYSDEILHRARLSPMKLSHALSEGEILRLRTATRDVLREWTDLLRAQAGDAFPEKVTAFHDEMAVHGKYGQLCPVCQSTVQRIRYAENEANYCPTCQTGGKLLADRALSRLLKKDWPRTAQELEEIKTPR